MIDASFLVALFKDNENIDIRHINLFQKYEKSPLKVSRHKKVIKIKIYCDECKEENRYNIPLKLLTRPGGHHVYCCGCGYELGYLGSKTDVEAVVTKHRRQVELLIHEMGLDEYFTNPLVVFELINYIHDMAENKKIYCQCSSQDVAASLSSDKIELTCKKCGATYIVKAGDRKDLEAVKKMGSIIIKSKSCDKLIKY
ncbi:MAG TPA: hypothetical protein GXZ27_08265 [Thermoanaerobacterales bacterium]|jgi:hypothetical protein|nr:hypothetical protein [Thermoanaerobacterales bacterium]